MRNEKNIPEPFCRELRTAKTEVSKAEAPKIETPYAREEATINIASSYDIPDKKNQPQTDRSYPANIELIILALILQNMV